MVREMPCASCSTTWRDIEAHHYGRGGTGTKCSDFETAPLCWLCHHAWHASGFLPERGREESIAMLDAANAEARERWANIQDPDVF